MSDQGDGGGQRLPDNHVLGEAFDIERKRGIFTKKDREYLTGELDIDGQDEYNLLFRLRERLQNSLLDLALAHNLDDDELQKVGDSMPPNPYSRFRYLTDFLHKYIRNHPNVDRPEDEIEQALERTLTSYFMVEEDSGSGSAVADVSVRIDIERADMRSLAEQIASGQGSETVLNAFTLQAEEEDVEALREMLDQNKNRPGSQEPEGESSPPDESVGFVDVIEGYAMEDDDEVDESDG